MYKKVIFLSFPTFSILSLLVYFAFGKYAVDKQILGVETNIIGTEKSINKSVNFLINQQKEFYIKESKNIFSDNRLLKALENRDRKEFYSTILHQFKRIQSRDKNFWGLHIILPNNLSFIRVHKPSVADKMIQKGSKPLIDQVNETKKVVVSFSDGKFGYFLRIVVPINILPKIENNLVIFKSTDKDIFGNCSLTHNLNTLKHSCNMINHKKYGNIDIILSETSILRIAFDITNIVKEQKEFTNIVNILVLSIIVIFFIVWYMFIKLFIKSKTEEKLRIEKEANLYEAQKMASMGEMIGNIAHQWRQPLSVISTGATGMKVQKEFGCLTDDVFINTCDTINENAQYLSQTIEDFKNYIRGNTKKQVFNLNDNLNSLLSLLQSTIKSNNIEVVVENKIDIKINGYENELTQCLLNLVNNSRDAFVENQIKDRYIFISTYIENDMAYIKIKDNATGISNEILPKIFEPYFTTKHKQQGTGLGLHMTYHLIVDGMNGTLNAKNKTYEYKSKSYTGAEFTISLPMN